MGKILVPIDIDELQKLKDANDEIIKQFEEMQKMVYKTNDRALNLAFYNTVAVDFIKMVGLWGQFDVYYNEKKKEYNQSRLGMN